MITLGLLFAAAYVALGWALWTTRPRFTQTIEVPVQVGERVVNSADLVRVLRQRRAANDCRQP